jgi:uncharacterized protein YbjQ (UPF0145 family)
MIGFGVFLVLLTIGFFAGRANETKHLHSLDIREQELSHIIVSTTKHIPDGYSQSQLITGNVVISIDYFKRIAAALRALFGGRIESYTILLERARREAIVRLLEDADNMGASMVANLRIETSSVFQNAQNQIGSLEVYAYATALR